MRRITGFEKIIFAQAADLKKKRNEAQIGVKRGLAKGTTFSSKAKRGTLIEGIRKSVKKAVQGRMPKFVPKIVLAGALAFGTGAAIPQHAAAQEMAKGKAQIEAHELPSPRIDSSVAAGIDFFKYMMDDNRKTNGYQAKDSVVEDDPRLDEIAREHAENMAKKYGATQWQKNRRCAKEPEAAWHIGAQRRAKAALGARPSTVWVGECISFGWAKYTRVAYNMEQDIIAGIANSEFAFVTSDSHRKIVYEPTLKARGVGARYVKLPNGDLFIVVVLLVTSDTKK